MGERDRVLNSGSWYVDGRPLIIKSPGIRKEKDLLQEIPKWVRFPGLGVEHWCDDELSSIASLVGSPLYMGEQTLLNKGLQFARLCIMIS